MATLALNGLSTSIAVLREGEAHRIGRHTPIGLSAVEWYYVQPRAIRYCVRALLPLARLSDDVPAGRHYTPTAPR